MASKDPVSIVLCGEAWQGVQTMEAFLTKLFKSGRLSHFCQQGVYVLEQLKQKAE